MINISACEFGEFKKYMISQYGEETFTEGYNIIKTNRSTVYENKGEVKLAQMLSALKFADEESLKGFLNICTTYLIV
jgi:DNA/RNA endonuclease YhcR with UshA esterase domain